MTFWLYLASFPAAIGLVAVAISPLFPERRRYKGMRRYRYGWRR